MKNIIFLFLLLGFFSLHGQNKVWDRVFGGSENDRLAQIIQLNNGTFMGIGTSNSPVSGIKSQPSLGGNDFWVVKLDENGNKIWDKVYGSERSDEGVSIRQLIDGTIVLAGNTRMEDTFDYDYRIIRIDENGNVLWNKTFGGGVDDWCYSVTSDVDDNVYVLGHSKSGIYRDRTIPNLGWSLSGDTWLLKLNKYGNKLDEFAYQSDDRRRNIVYTSNNTLAFLEISSSSLKVRVINPADGDIIKTFSPYLNGERILSCKLIEKDGYFYVSATGSYSIYEYDNHLIQATYLFTYNGSEATGASPVWSKRDPGSVITRDILVNEEKVIIVCNTPINYGIKEYDLNGNLQNNISLTNLHNDQPTGLCHASDGFLIGGSFYFSSYNPRLNSYGGEDWWIAKVLTGCPQPPSLSSATPLIYIGQTANLTAEGCDGGEINWNHNLGVGEIKSVTPEITTTYTATCSMNGCVSENSSLTIIVNPCPVSVNHSGNIDGNIYKAAETINSTSKLIGNTIYQAGKSILLMPGFLIEDGNVFETAIKGGCD